MRANTINHTDVIPPALARLQHMNQDVIAGRNALTPVLNRDDAMREWERRQSGKPPAAQPYPQLEYLQQQAELAAAGGLGGWSAGPGGGAGPGPGGAPGAGAGAGATGRYQAAPSKLSHSYQPTIIVDDDSRREAVMSNVRSAARGDAGPSTGYNPSAMVTSPPQTYATGLGGGGGGGGGGTTGSAGGPGGGPGTVGGGGGTRYSASYAQQQASNSPFDALGQRTDIGTMYVPLQPDQYPSYGTPAGGGGGVGVVGPVRTQGVNAPPATQGGTPSFYGPSVAGAQGRNPFSGAGGTEGGAGGQGQGGKRLSGMDLWSR
jgi:dual specificity protein kinase YAK1